MYLIKKIKNWYQGKFIEGKCISSTEDNSSVILEIETDRYEQPLLAKILNVIGYSFKFIGQFWLKRWTILLPLIVTTIVALFIHFDSKATRKTKEKKENNVSKAYFNHEVSK